VEDASRFARELITQQLGIMALINRRVRVLTANGDDLTDSTERVLAIISAVHAELTWSCAGETHYLQGRGRFALRETLPAK